MTDGLGEGPEAADESTGVPVRVLHTGSVTIDRALAFREETRHPAPHTGWLRPRSARIRVPVSAYLIEHPDGRVLVDTGWHTDVRTDQRGHLGWVRWTMFRGDLPAGRAVHEQLDEMGIGSAELEYVVLTHLDSDHVSGLRQVSHARNVLVSRPEWEARGGLRYVPSMWEGVDVAPFDLEEIPHGPREAGLDLFGDGRVYLVHTPGHSVGQVSVLVDAGDGWVLLASDVGYASRSWEEGVLPGLTEDDEDARASLDWVAEFAARDDCVAALANHDPDVEPGPV